MGLCWHHGSLGLAGLAHELKIPSWTCQFDGTKVESSEPASDVPAKVRMATIANHTTTPLLTRLKSRLMGSPFRSGVPRLQRCAHWEAGSSVARRSTGFHSTFVEGDA